jgi:uncharacterized protein YcnI
MYARRRGVTHFSARLVADAVHPYLPFGVRFTVFPLSVPRRARLVLVPAVATAVVALAALPASAHVTISPDTAAQGGGDVQLTFRVPNEETNASTTQLQVAFPTDHPIASVLVQPMPGWTAKVDTATLSTPIHTDDGDISQVVSQITWSGGSIAPGQYGAFTVLLGQLPSGTSQIAFKSVQTYSNGDVVRWIDLTQAGQPAPDHPAPVLTLTKAGASTDTAASSNTAASSGGTTAAAASTSDSTARGLGIGGLVVGVLGLATAAFALTRRRGAGDGSPSGDESS